MNIGHATDISLASVPERGAIVVDGTQFTYRQLEGLIGKVASALAAAGVGPGDRVALVDLGSALSVATIYAAARLGAASAQMNAYLTSGELAQLAELVGARVGVAGSRYAANLGLALDGRVLGEEEILATETDASAAASVGDGPDTALVLFTSGTTGLPKPIFISHDVVTDRLGYYAKPIDPGTPQQVDMMSAPIFHIGGTLGLLISLHSGKQTVLLPKFDAGEWLELVERYRVAQTFVVPAMLRRILDHPRFTTADLSSLQSLSYGAAAAPVDLVRRALTALPEVDFANTFGQTETLGAYSALTPADHRRGDRLGSVGRPFPGVEMRIVDPTTMEPVAPGGVGEFLVRATQTTTTEWLHTGDSGWQDEEGYLFVSGRLSDTINRGGEKFGPVEVEDVIRDHPLVIDVGVVGVPDTDLGERVGAVVVTSESVAAESLVGHCVSRLATYKVPEYLVFAPELPFTALGKLDRKALRGLLRDAPAVRRQRNGPESHQTGAADVPATTRSKE
ncbi:MAG: class I adenylate-forming enzyme family protein [Acidimicrobiales bacterium]